MDAPTNSGFSFSKRSRDSLIRVHSDLVLVMFRALQLSPIDFIITEGERSLKRQRALIASGDSQLKNPQSSRHIANSQGIVHAVDFVPWVDGHVSWEWWHFDPVGAAIKRASVELTIPVEWGGDWTGRYKDGPHVQLPKPLYP